MQQPGATASKSNMQSSINMVDAYKGCCVM
jgi:hypothetical protein